MGRETKNAFAAATLALVCASVARADVAYEVTAGVGHSDNISRVDEGAIDETLASAGVTLEWVERTRRLEGDALVDLTYVEYLDDTYDGEVLGIATADLDFGIIPERFHWQVADTFGQAQSDPFAPVTPDTRENVNYFSTGPDLFLRFGQELSAQVYGRYSLTSYEESPLDAERTALGFAIGRDTSTRSHVALNFVADETTFDDAGNTDYERRNAYLSYELRSGGRMTIDSRLGYTWLEMDGAEAEGGLLVDVSATREMTPSSTLTVSAAHQFSDAGESLTTSGEGGLGSITASSDPFESTEASLEWGFNRNRTSIGLSATYNERTYETQTVFDSTRIYYRADLGRVLRPTLRAGFIATLANEEFENTGAETDELSLGLTLDWQFARHLGLRLRAERFDRSSTGGLSDYKENRVFLEFTFRGDRAPGSM